MQRAPVRCHVAVAQAWVQVRGPQQALVRSGPSVMLLPARGASQALVRDGLWFSAGSGPPQALVRDGLLFFLPGVVPQFLGSRGSRQESMQCFAGSEKQSGAVPISTPAPSIQPPKFPTHSEPMRAARDSILIRQQNTAQYRNLVCGLRTVLRQRHARSI